jgi:hypothetical protein
LTFAAPAFSLAKLIHKGTGDPLFGMNLTEADLKNLYNIIICYCGNLGWLPPDYKTS